MMFLSVKMRLNFSYSAVLEGFSSFCCLYKGKNTKTNVFIFFLNEQSNERSKMKAEISL